MRWLARLLLLRFLPRRLVPFLTAWEILQLVRNRNRKPDAGEMRRIAPPRTTPGAATRRPPTR